MLFYTKHYEVTQSIIRLIEFALKIGFAINFLSDKLFDVNRHKIAKMSYEKGFPFRDP